MWKSLLLSLLFFLFPVTSEAKEAFFYFYDGNVITPKFSFHLEDSALFKGDIRFSADKGNCTLYLASKDNATKLNVVCLSIEKNNAASLPYFLPSDWRQMTQDKQMFSKWLKKMEKEVFDAGFEVATFKIIPQQKANTGKIIMTDKTKRHDNFDEGNDLLCGFLYEAQGQELRCAGAVILHKNDIYTITYLSDGDLHVFTQVLETLELFHHQ